MSKHDPRWPGQTEAEEKKLALVRALATAYVPRAEQEGLDRKRLLAALDQEPRLLYREALPVHCTASVWITDPRRENVLLAWHKLYRSWAWLGGHADGEGDLLGVALREVREESGLADVRLLLAAPISLEILPVAPQMRRGEAVPAHEHANFTWLLEADPASPLCVKEDENTAIRWVDRAQVPAFCAAEPDMLPVYAKLDRRLEEYRQAENRE